jgi:cysteine-rich repeat protein
MLMHRHHLLGLLLAGASLTACNGDDAADSETVGDPTTNTASATNTSTSTSAGTSTATGGESMTTTDGGSESDSEGTTTAASATDPSTTDPSTTDPSTTDPSTTDPSTTDPSTTDPTEGGVCGDGNLDPGEQCDDGNEINGDGCQADCKLPPAGLCPGQDDYIVCDQNTTDWYKAFGLGCSNDQSNAVVIESPMMNSNNPNAWRIAKGFGTYLKDGKLLYSPREGDSFLMVSTGVIAQPNGQGVVTEAFASQEGNGENGNDSSDNLPAPMSHLKGSNNGQGGTPFMNCDGVKDCSDTLFDNWVLGSEDPNDKLWFSFKATVPQLVKSYSFNFAYFSSEWPFWVDTTFNDLFIAWQVSEAYTGNVTFINGQPLTVTALDPYLSTDGYSDNEPQLQGTGFEGNAGSDWFGANQNVMPGETLSMTFFIADMGDEILATLAIVDNFRWQCDECIPIDDPACTGEVPDPACCGVIEPQ